MKNKRATIEEPSVIEHVPKGDEVPEGGKVVEEVPKSLKPIPKPPPPFPQRLAKKADDEKFLKFIEKLKQLSINIPLVEALELRLGYTKFMKDLVTKRRHSSFETMGGPHHCSSIVTKALVQNKEDPGGFAIPTTIGMYKFAKALCDLGACINLMPLSIFNNLGLGTPRPITMRLLMADRNVKKRPFLATGPALVDVNRGDLKFIMNDEEITFHIFKSMRQPTDMSVVSVIDTINEAMETTVEHEYVGEMLAAMIMNYEEENEDEFEETVNAMMGLGTYKYNPKKA
ncbi:uncharacterized protein LOC132628352 [Lycium barbarum]|uniref:uncharacterized protein LOC132628352 n=1 Tax=Lycium barbarum TaxID=112863 RepID=UPI00293EB838|nr:uncharacterized protein LOC132628352 [Lycium barbarum]